MPLLGNRPESVFRKPFYAQTLELLPDTAPEFYESVDDRLEPTLQFLEQAFLGLEIKGDGIELERRMQIELRHLLAPARHAVTVAGDEIEYR